MDSPSPPNALTAAPVLLRVLGVQKSYALPRTLADIVNRRPARSVLACDGVDLELESGQSLGIVGESGSGKSTLGRILLRLEQPDAGVVEFEGRDLARLSPPELRRARRDMQIVFQDPLASLNPRFRVERAVTHALRTHGLVRSAADQRQAALDLLRLVGLPAEVVDRFPHELSGGQAQRVCIARAVALRPKLVVADEPVSALDVSVQAQILNLMKRLQRDLRLAYVFISHDLRVVRHLCQRVAVMYAGQIVEAGPTGEVFAAPKHPYTRALLDSVPSVATRDQVRRAVRGEPLNPADMPAGCRFAPRCPLAVADCSARVPDLLPLGRPEHLSRCLVEQRRQSE